MSETRVYATLFNSYFASRGIALLESLKQHDPNFRLYVFAFDELTEKILKSLQEPRVIVVPLKDFETPELKKVKAERSLAEYCWTCTPWIVRHVLEKFNEAHCTYADADICLYSSVQPIFDEVGSNSILLTEHGFASDFDRIEQAGRYCVQFMFFRNDERGTRALQWWSERCLEWCYDRYEDGKFGDQKYLDDWTTRFQGVHVLKHPGGGVAIWNISRFNFGEGADHQVMLTEKTTGQKVPLIFYHFHGLRFLPNAQIMLGYAHLTPALKYLVYLPYLKRVLQLEQELTKGWQAQGYKSPQTILPSGLRPFLGRLKKRLLGKYHVHSADFFQRSHA